MRLAVSGTDFSTLQQANRTAVGMFVTQNKDKLYGKVLDFGCGKSPYKALVPGEYIGFDPGYTRGWEAPPSGPYDAIIATQVLQFMGSPEYTLWRLSEYLKPGGCFVITYHASWYEAQNEDTWRISKEGMARLLKPMEILKHEAITTLSFPGFDINLTYGVVARKT